MKKAKKVLSLCMVMVLLLVSSVFSAYANSKDDEYYCCNSDNIGLLSSSSNKLLYDTVDGAEYTYIVVDGEAAIINVRINYCGPEKISFTFPEKLGGYPVTRVGYPKESGRSVEVFIDTTYEYEYDPSLYYVSEIIIPEGYKYIETLSFYGTEAKITFPKSLREINGYPFYEIYTHADENGGKYTVLPDCYFSYPDVLAEIFPTWGRNKYIILPSRFEDNSGDILKVLKSRDHENYVPSNISTEDFYNTLYYFEGAAGDAGEIWPRYDARCTIHCAPDSEFLSVFDEYGEHPYATIITDVVPAEYIEFPEETVNVCVGDVVDLEAKTYPAEAVWTACDYTVSDPSIVQIDDYSGRITALKEGTVTVTAKHCERGFVDTCTVNVVPESASGVQEIKPATDTPYYSYGNRDYKLELTGSPSKIQVVRSNGATTTIDRSKATITSNGDTETWVVNMRVEAGEHAIRAKYGKVWDEATLPFTVEYDTPKADAFSLTYENGMGTFEVVTDPQIAKIQFVLDNGATLTYSQSYSHIGEDGMRHWTVSRKLPVGTTYTLKTKLGNVWSSTDLTVKT